MEFVEIPMRPSGMGRFLNIKDTNSDSSMMML